MSWNLLSLIIRASRHLRASKRWIWAPPPIMETAIRDSEWRTRKAHSCDGSIIHRTEHELEAWERPPLISHVCIRLGSIGFFPKVSKGRRNPCTELPRNNSRDPWRFERVKYDLPIFRRSLDNYAPNRTYKYHRQRESSKTTVSRPLSNIFRMSQKSKFPDMAWYGSWLGSGDKKCLDCAKNAVYEIWQRRKIPDNSWWSLIRLNQDIQAVR